jgi:two-component system cell cycle sensor histidine kinase/response regulator CckA
MLCSGTRPNISYRTPLASMSETYRVLIVDDDDAQAEMMREFLHISGYANIDRAANIHDFWQLLKKGPYDIILLDYKLPDGTGLDVLEQMAARGHHIPVVMITGQGNERIAAKQSVQRSLEQIRYQALLLNNVRDAVVVWDMAERITFWNPAAAALFGWSADERLGRPVSQIYLHTFSPAITLPREESRGGSQPVVRKFINREGNTLWVSSRLAILRDEERGGRLIGYMDVSRDITRRVETEQALRDSEARYRAIVEDYQTELICRFKPNGSLTFVNEVYCRYFGKPREELLGMNFLYFIPESERPKIVQHLLSFSPEKTVARLEHQVKLPSKGLRWLQRTDRAILDDEGRIFEFQSMARDISEQKRMEAQIKAAQAHLVQAARMATIGEMASGVAHQIYNPLTTIIADAQILLRELPPEQPGRDSAEAIEQAGWRLQQAVQRLMEFSRPTSETLGAISINDTLRSAISLVNAHIDATGCRLEVDLAEDLPPVRGNPRQLESLWVNLLLLARDASANEHDQTIWVSSAPGSSETVIIEVRDNGQPIPKEQLGTIFEPNFVGPSSGRGTGMELSICREIVRQHGGQITADSGRDRDTIFRVALPVEV